ncbi:PucR family transcriptional regulator [Saccharopolyspora sp. CA-218241]|uniref:PucR family transcriptional regulator n=1 Tax=Saccharopolyspora sp. CA-218241 TaxID=3240027 RepID=UPI003D962D1C
MERLVSRLGDHDALLDFVDEHLGPLFDQPPPVRDRLLTTLTAFFDCSTNKTATAQRLHLQRQTLYQRLDRLSEHLGQDVTAAESAPALHLALRLRQAMSSLPHHRRPNLTGDEP